MDAFSFEELIADMLGISDDQRDKDPDHIEILFHEKFGIDMEQGHAFAKALLVHTPKVQAGLSGTTYHAFVSKTDPIMLMKVEAEAK